MTQLQNVKMVTDKLKELRAKSRKIAIALDGASNPQTQDTCLENRVVANLCEDIITAIVNKDHVFLDCRL
jgi:hypothetical protein